MPGYAWFLRIACFISTASTQRPTSGQNIQGDNMSAIDTNRVHGGAGSLGIGSKICAELTAWNDARVTKNALNRLTDRELDDIGLNRGDIERIAYLR